MLCTNCGNQLNENNFTGIEDKWGKYCVDCEKESESYNQQLNDIKNQFEELIKEIFCQLNTDNFNIEYYNRYILIRMKDGFSYMAIITRHYIEMSHENNTIGLFPQTLNKLQYFATKIIKN